MTTPQPESTYRERVARFTALRDREQQRSDRNGNISLGLIIITLVFFGLWLWQAQPLPLAGAASFGLAFLVSFIRHGDVNRRRDTARDMLAISQEGLARLARRWDSIPLGDPAAADPAHPYAADLDVQGRASLEHLLHTPATPAGRAALRAWLLAPAAPEQILRRQAAVAELAPQIELRDELALRGRQQRGGSQATFERLLTWAESPPWLLARPWLVWLPRALAVAALALLAARLLGLPVGAPLATVLLVNTGLYFALARIVELRIEQVAQRQAILASYAELFACLLDAKLDSPELQHIQQQLHAQSRRADAQMRRLARIMPAAEIRKWIFFFPIQVATLWSFHVLWALERWQRENGPHARQWLAALGDAEALAALATLAYDHPSWIFPTLAEQPGFAARQLGHPLLPPAACVGNDVALGPPGTMLLITGSNMSGKSTLLRAIGLNTVLAQAGGPVCASQLRLSPMDVASSMRVRDSVEQGISYFMAELQRLKFVVDRAALVRADGGRTLLFLLDEILHGTNSAERLIAARAILVRLLDQGALGAVSTHDLALAESGDLPARATLVHFREHFRDTDAGPTMFFDYQLREGIATSTNALALVRQLLGPDVVGEA
ncbi:DNA mismatch repair protein MutS [Chloroflexia bacterium SDU3-3]|nr:DNA mismatch repair protein MutS [Chloroflexia bacterium SDU3-3]